MVRLHRATSRTVCDRQVQYICSGLFIKSCMNFHMQKMHPKESLLFLAGICGGSASGKTTVAEKIIESLDVPWVTLLSMDSFYKVLLNYSNL